MALIQLDGEINFFDRIQPIRLPKVGGSNPIDGTKLLVSGWGVTDIDYPQTTRFLRAVEVPIVFRFLCNIPYLGKVTERMFCAGYIQGGKDCKYKMSTANI